MSPSRQTHWALSATTVVALILSLVVTAGMVGAAPTRQDSATITSSAGNSNIIPFGTNAVTITFNGGTDSSGKALPATVCFAYNGGGGSSGAQTLFAQTPGGNQSATFTGVNQSGLYSFILYAGLQSICPAPGTASGRLDLTKANPFPGVGSGTAFAASTGTGLALVVPANPVIGTSACPGPQAGAAGGAFTGSPTVPAPGAAGPNPAGGAGQYVGYQQGSGPVPVDGKDYTLTASTTLPRTLCIAFDAGYRSDNTQRPEVLVFVSVNNSSLIGPLARGPFGYVQFNAVVSGSYRFTEYDVASGGGTGAPITGANCTSTFAVPAAATGPCDETVSTNTTILTSASSYTGGTAAIVPFVYDSGIHPFTFLGPPFFKPGGGNPTYVCVYNAGAPGGSPFAAPGLLASYTNNGALSTTINGLPPSATFGGMPYTLQMYTAAFSAGPQQITSANSACGGTAVSNGTPGAGLIALLIGTPAGPVPPYASNSSGMATFTITP